MVVTSVHYGSLRVAAGVRHDFDQAVGYLQRDPGERALIDKLEHGSQHVTLTANARDLDYYDPNTHVIHWDPHSAMRTSDGHGQTPALGLGHEIDHAVHGGPREWTRANTPDVRYDTAEERRVITGSERHAARTLGEGVRHDHDGVTYRVASPTAMLLIA